MQNFSAHYLEEQCVISHTLEVTIVQGPLKFISQIFDLTRFIVIRVALVVNKLDEIPSHTHRLIADVVVAGRGSRPC